MHLFKKYYDESKGNSANTTPDKGHHSEPVIDRRAAGQGRTVICIFVCGTLLLSVGISFLCIGIFVQKTQTPWLVAGPTCIVLGLLILLLSIEVIIKLRKKARLNRSDSYCQSSDLDVDERKISLGYNTRNEENSHKIMLLSTDTNLGSSSIPVIVNPPTPVYSNPPSPKEI